MSQFQDMTLTCEGSKKEPGCGMQFVFTAGEQEFYDRKGFKEVPKRCKPCREKRKAAKDGQSAQPVDQTREFWEQEERAGGGGGRHRDRGRRDYGGRRGGRGR